MKYEYNFKFDNLFVILSLVCKIPALLTKENKNKGDVTSMRS